MGSLALLPLSHQKLLHSEIVVSYSSKTIQLFSHQQPAWVLLNVKWSQDTLVTLPLALESVRYMPGQKKQSRKKNVHEVLSLGYKKIGFASPSNPSLAVASSSPRQGTLGMCSHGG